MTTFRLAGFIAILLAVTMSITQAQQKNDAPNTGEIIAQIGDSPAQAVAVNGGYAYVGFGNKFSVIDISDITNPAITGQLTMTYPIDDILTDGNYLYTTSGVGGLQIGDGFQVIDVSNPENPTQINDYLIDQLQDLILINDRIYLIDGFYFRILDISNPLIIEELGHYQPANGWTTRINVQNEIAFIMDGAPANMYIVDIADPAQPALISTWEGLGGLWQTALKPNQYYIASVTCSSICVLTLGVSDISDLTLEEPVPLSYAQAEGHMTYVLELGTLYGYVGMAEGLAIFNIGDPNDLTYVDTLFDEGWQYSHVKDVFVTNDYLFVASIDGLSIVVAPPTKQLYLPLIFTTP